MPFQLQWLSDILQHLSRAHLKCALYITHSHTRAHTPHIHFQPSVIGCGVGVVAAIAIVERRSDCSERKPTDCPNEKSAGVSAGSDTSLHKSIFLSLSFLLLLPTSNYSSTIADYFNVYEKSVFSMLRLTCYLFIPSITICSGRILLPVSYFRRLSISNSMTTFTIDQEKITELIR